MSTGKKRKKKNNEDSSTLTSDNSLTSPAHDYTLTDQKAILARPSRHFIAGTLKLRSTFASISPKSLKKSLTKSPSRTKIHAEPTTSGGHTKESGPQAHDHNTDRPQPHHQLQAHFHKTKAAQEDNHRNSKVHFHAAGHQGAALHVTAKSRRSPSNTSPRAGSPRRSPRSTNTTGGYLDTGMRRATASSDAPEAPTKTRGARGTEVSNNTADVKVQKKTGLSSEPNRKRGTHGTYQSGASGGVLSARNKRITSHPGSATHTIVEHVTFPRLAKKKGSGHHESNHQPSPKISNLTFKAKDNSVPRWRPARTKVGVKGHSPLKKKKVPGHPVPHSDDHLHVQTPIFEDDDDDYYSDDSDDEDEDDEDDCDPSVRTFHDAEGLIISIPDSFVPIKPFPPSFYGPPKLHRLDFKQKLKKCCVIL